MGLLDQILGGALRPGSSAGRASIGGGKGRLIMLLLPLVLQMLASRRPGAGVGQAPPAGPVDDGGPGGVLSGGLGGLLEKLTRRGFGAQAQSWVSTGPNQPLPPEAVNDLFASQDLAALAAQAGVGEDDVREGLAEVLPEVVDKLTPDGQLPGQAELLASIDDFERRLPAA